MYHLAHLALAGEALRHFGCQVYGFDTGRQSFAADFKLRYACKHVEQRLFVQLRQTFFSRLSKQNVAGLHCHIVVFLAVHHDGDFLGQAFLQDALSRVFIVLGDEAVYLFFVQRGEDTDIAFGVVVGHVEPELVEGIRAGIVAVQPDVALFGLAELGSVGFCHQRAYQSEHFTAVGTAYQFGAGCDVTPLVASAQLETAAFMFV